MASEVANAYETARAEGRFVVAWALLAPLSQSRIGTLEAYGEGEAAYNALGGSIYDIQPPTQDEETLLLLAGAVTDDIGDEADMSRGSLVSVLHPDIDAASAGTTILFIAPLKSGDWRVWLIK